jgi:hypothetical protein
MFDRRLAREGQQQQKESEDRVVQNATAIVLNCREWYIAQQTNGAGSFFPDPCPNGTDHRGGGYAEHDCHRNPQ